jgi:hypothetical protein
MLIFREQREGDLSKQQKTVLASASISNEEGYAAIRGALKGPPPERTDGIVSRHNPAQT